MLILLNRLILCCHYKLCCHNMSAVVFIGIGDSPNQNYVGSSLRLFAGGLHYASHRRSYMVYIRYVCHTTMTTLCAYNIKVQS